MLLKKLVFVCLMIPVFLCSGCWDVEEVNHRATPNALYFDVGEQDNVQLGINMHVPGTLQPPINNMEHQFEKNHSVLFAEGKSSVEAWSKLQTMTSRNIFFGQLSAIIVSDKYAARDIADSLDFIGRIPVVSGDTQLLITKDDPKELLELKNKGNFIPGNYIEQYFQSPYKAMMAKPIKLFEVLARTDNKTADPYFPMISSAQGNYVISRTAVFSGNRMVGELDQQETQAFSMLTGASTGLLSVPVGENDIVSYLLTDTKNKIVPHYTNGGTLAFDIQVEVEGIVTETNPYRGPLEMEDKKRMDRAAEDYLQGKTEKLLVKLQGLNSDPVGFGEKLRSRYPDRWENTDWHQVFPQVQFSVDVKFNTKETGLFS